MEKHFLVITLFEGEVETKVFKAKDYNGAMQKFDNAATEYNARQYVQGVFVCDSPITKLSK